jgi:hypothetical protein
VFIVPTNHATINTTSVTTAKFLAGTTDYTYGHIRINPVASHPFIKNFGIGGYNSAPAGKAGEIGEGFRDITTLTYWGSVIIETNSTGFAMEFVGDMNDSQTPSGLADLAAVAVAGGEGFMASGVNLQ